MASVTQNFMKLFRGSSGGTEATTPQGAQKLTRRSSSLGELARVWEADTPLCVLDLGSTSASNIRFFTERSHKIYSLGQRVRVLVDRIDPVEKKIQFALFEEKPALKRKNR